MTLSVEASKQQKSMMVFRQLFGWMGSVHGLQQPFSLQINGTALSQPMYLHT